MKIKLFFIILSFMSLVIFNLNSYIYRVSQLKNSTTGQRVLLYSDVHNGPEFFMSKNKDQKSLILNQVDKVINNKNYAIIVENDGLSVRDVVERYKRKLDNSYKKFVNRAPVFWDIKNKYKDKVLCADQLRYSDICFEEAFSFQAICDNLGSKRFWGLLGLIIDDYKYLNNHTIARKIKKIKKECIVDYKVDLIWRLNKHSVKCLNEVKKKINQAYKVNKDLYNHIIRLFRKVEQSFIVNSINDYANGYNKISDIEMLLAINNLYDKKKIILFAGGEHLDNIESILLASGYIKEFSDGLKVKGFCCDVDSYNLMKASEYYQKKFDNSRVKRLIKPKSLNSFISQIYYLYKNSRKSIKNIVYLKNEVFELISNDNLNFC